MTLTVNCSTMPSVSLLYVFSFLNVTMHSFSGDTMSLPNARSPILKIYDKNMLYNCHSPFIHTSAFSWEPEMKCAKQSIHSKYFCTFATQNTRKRTFIMKNQGCAFIYRTRVFFYHIRQNTWWFRSLFLDLVDLNCQVDCYPFNVFCTILPLPQFARFRQLKQKA